MRSTLMPERSSTSSTSKTPPGAESHVDGLLFYHEELGIQSTFGGADLDDD
jgi:hypothetical protein